MDTLKRFKDDVMEGKQDLNVVFVWIPDAYKEGDVIETPLDKIRPTL